jgi:hypothetical protein
MFRNANLIWCWKYKILLYIKVHDISLEHVNYFEKYPINNKLLKTFIKHYNMCFLAIKWFINKLQFFWKLHIFWNLLHKHWHNNILKIYKKIWRIFEDFLKNIFKNIPPKAIPKASGCNSCYLICTQYYMKIGFN